jgi:GTPase
MQHNAKLRLGRGECISSNLSLGVCYLIDECRFACIGHADQADIPGLIAGAAEGAGIGDRFLGHIERCRVLLHLVDATGDDPVEQFRIVQDELAAYGEGLEDKPQIVALNKGDLLGQELMEDIAAQLREEAGVEDVFIISGATGDGVPALLDAVLPLLVEAQTAEDAPDEESDTPWSPI